MPTRAFDSIDAIISVLRTAGLTVVDGPAEIGDYQAMVFVGYDGNPEGDWKALDGDQDWAAIGNRSRDERFDVICAALAPYDETIKSGRDAVKALLATVETTLRANLSLGFDSPYVAGVIPRELFYEDGAARHVFLVRVMTRV